jgi:hypothetical protein
MTRRMGRIFEAFGERRTMREWANHSGISRTVLSNRVCSQGISMEEAITMGNNAKRGRKKGTGVKIYREPVSGRIGNKDQLCNYLQMNANVFYKKVRDGKILRHEGDAV